jgi:hypothetical protein
LRAHVEGTDGRKNLQQLLFISFPRLSWATPTVPELPMADVTQILSAIEHGDLQAAEQLLPLVYDEPRQLAAQRLACESPGQTLQATALVHEAYLRLVDVDKVQHWNSRGHFFSWPHPLKMRVETREQKHAKREVRVALGLARRGVDCGGPG